MTERRFLIFVRSDRFEWRQHGEAEDGLGAAVSIADVLVLRGKCDRAVVMEASGTDALPMFTYRHGARA